MREYNFRNDCIVPKPYVFSGFDIFKNNVRFFFIEVLLMFNFILVSSI